jgi:hypothetical protein
MMFGSFSVCQQQNYLKEEEYPRQFQWLGLTSATCALRAHRGGVEPPRDPYLGEISETVSASKADPLKATGMRFF